MSPYRIMLSLINIKPTVSRNMVSETVTCMRRKKEAVGEDLIPFRMAIYLPCLFCVLIAMIMVPIKVSGLLDIYSSSF